MIPTSSSASETDPALPSEAPPVERPTRRSWRDWYLVTIVVGAAAFCLGPSLAGTRSLLSVNSLTGYFPWIAARGPGGAGHEGCTGDTIDAGMAGIGYLRGQLFSGHLASWQSIVGGGAPLSSLPDLGLLDPLSLPYYLLPLWLAPAFVVLLTWFVAIGGTFLFLRRLSLSRHASLLAGFVFATSGFMVMWTNWPQTRVAALIPVLFWAVERLIQRGKPTDVVLVSVTVASMLLGGFPQVTGYALYLAAGYLLVRLYLRGRQSLRAALSTLAMAAGGLVLGILLAAVQMLPFLYFFRHSDLAYRSGNSRVGLPLSGLLTLIAPNANGLCITGRPTHGPSNPIEMVAYIGAASIVLAIAGAAFGIPGRSGRLRGLFGYFLGAAVVLLLLGWVSPTARSLVAPLPAFAGNFIGRIRSVLGFALAVLAAVGFDWLVGPRDRLLLRDRVRVPQRAWAAAIWIASAGAGLLILRRAHEAAFSAGYWRDVEHAIWIPALLLLAALVVLALSRVRDRGAQTFAFIVIPLLVVIQGTQFFHAVLPGDSTSNFYPNTPTHKFLESQIGHDRFASSAMTMYPATALYYGLRTPTGHVFHEPAWKDLLAGVDRSVMLTPTFSDFGSTLNQTTIARQPILDRMGVKYFVLPPSELAGAVEPLAPADGSVRATDGPLTCDLPGQPLRGVSLRLSQPLVASSRAGVTIDVTVSGAGGTISSGRYLGSGVPANTPLSVAVAGEDIRANGPLTVGITARGADGPLSLSARKGAPLCGAVTQIADGLKVVYADAGSIIYQRLDALPRIRWASRSVVVRSSAQRVATLAGGLPTNEVVLDEPGPAGSARSARVTVTADSGDEIAADVVAAGSGYLVVADAMQEAGWKVSVDGKPATLVAADDAMVAVAVPAGAHRIGFSYTAPDQSKGAALSAVGVLIASSLIWWQWRRRPTRSRS